jgi:hypothetical protein
MRIDHLMRAQITPLQVSQLEVGPTSELFAKEALFASLWNLTEVRARAAVTGVDNRMRTGRAQGVENCKANADR